MRVLILGINGQDGAYTAKICLEKGFQVHGTMSSDQSSFRTLKYLGIEKQVTLQVLDYGGDDSSSHFGSFDLVFNYAALSSLSLSEADRCKTIRINYSSPKRLFDGLLSSNPKVRIFQASSALVFDRAEGGERSEVDHRSPDTFYGQAKHALDSDLEQMRSLGVFASSGILFNHESPLRGDGFVSQKIVNGIAKLKLVEDEPVQLRSFSDQRDWMHAEDTCNAALTILQHDEPDEWVIASGKLHKVLDWVMLSAEFSGFRPALVSCNEQDKVICSETGKTLAIAPVSDTFDNRSTSIFGSTNKLRRATDWSPKNTFAELVEEMTRSALDKYRKAGLP